MTVQTINRKRLTSSGDQENENEAKEKAEPIAGDPKMELTQNDDMAMKQLTEDVLRALHITEKDEKPVSV